MATTRRTHMRRALACAATATCCVLGVSSPSDAADTPVPVPPSPVSRSPELPVLPGHEIMMTATLAPRASDDMGERVNVSELQIRLRDKHLSPKITLDECTMLANTFWSGSAPNYHSTVDYDMGICVLTAHYANDARHAFYSLDEDGTITARAPMVYLHQIASSFETVHFTRFDYWFSAIVNTQCNADPSHTKLDAPPIGQRPPDHLHVEHRQGRHHPHHRRPPHDRHRRTKLLHRRRRHRRALHRPDSARQPLHHHPHAGRGASLGRRH